nr:IS3 family transposase [Lachnospiraceae bacterium]
SDRGTQYSSESYQRMLRENGIRQSMSRGGCPYDNACSESFFATAKKEGIYQKNYATIAEVKADILEYIEMFYNRKRMHSYLGYMSPVEYRLIHSA